ncbi:NAD(P)-binding domain-containing protein [Cyclobacteriaceae bacterium]|nr:NAD(P)-binding domain-containing protein [Cyclobacteriaceae bacterium]MDC6484269.1 NAD(P)-binding domain-containing protein [Cyclobacteriaceae bacterium]
MTLIKKNDSNYCISILGCGWLGLPLARQLVQQGHQIKGSTTSQEKIEVLKSIGIIPYLIKLTEEEPQWVDFLKTDVLVIAIPLKEIKPFEYLIKNLPSTVKVIYTSSTAVYLPSTEPINEKGALDTQHHLLAIEQVIRNSENPSTIIRLAGLFDQRRHPGRWFANKVLNNPNGPVNLIHLDDCLGIINKIITHQVWNEIFNACANEHPSRKDFYSRASRALGSPPPQINEQKTSIKIIDNRWIKKKLDFSFHVSLNDFEKYI